MLRASLVLSCHFPHHSPSPMLREVTNWGVFVKFPRRLRRRSSFGPWSPVPSWNNPEMAHAQCNHKSWDLRVTGWTMMRSCSSFSQVRCCVMVTAPAVSCCLRWKLHCNSPSSFWWMVFCWPWTMAWVRTLKRAKLPPPMPARSFDVSGKGFGQRWHPSWWSWRNKWKSFIPKSPKPKFRCWRSPAAWQKVAQKIWRRSSPRSRWPFLCSIRNICLNHHRYKNSCWCWHGFLRWHWFACGS